MPKVTETYASKVRKYQLRYSDVFTTQTNPITNTTVLYCQCCCAPVNCNQKSHVEQHLQTKSHREKCQNFKSKQQSVNDLFTNKQKVFNNDLCQFAVALNIPLTAFSSPEAKNFIEKYSDFKVPSDETLRTTCLDTLYRQKIDDIRNALKGKYLWVSFYNY